MTETHRIRNQLKRAYRGPAWHGPSLTELLAGVTPAQAAARPLAGVHSIWEIVLHVTAWRQEVRRRLDRKYTELQPEQDWPAVPEIAEASWKQTLEALEASQQDLLVAISRMEDAQLEEILPEAKYDYYILLHGLVQHDLYHAGQIAVLKRA